MHVRWLLATLVLGCAAACGGSSPAATTSATTPSSTATPRLTMVPTPSPLRDEVLLDLMGTGGLAKSRTFTVRGAAVNICWRLTGGAETDPPQLMVRVHDAMTGEERSAISTDKAPSGCRTTAVRAVGQSHYVSVTVSEGTAWHVAVVGQ